VVFLSWGGTIVGPVHEQQKAVLGGIWLIGLGILFATRFCWPGIMFLIAITAIIEGWLNDQPWYGAQAAYWSVFIGVWALTRYSFTFLLIGLGVSTIVAALVKPNPFSKPKPFVNSSLE
jgi:hydrogenase/urease accessory protein HupE